MPKIKAGCLLPNSVIEVEEKQYVILSNKGEVKAKNLSNPKENPLTLAPDREVIKLLSFEQARNLADHIFRTQIT